MRNAFINRVFSYTLLFLFACSPIASADRIQVAAGEWPPYLSKELKHYGAVAHLISDVFAKQGVEVEFIFMPWGRAYEAAANGTYDVTAVWMHKAEREKDFLYSDPVLQEQFVFFHLKSLPFDWNELSDLQGMMIGGGIKYSYGPEFDAALEAGDLHIDRVSSDKQNFSKLLLNRIHIFPQEVNVGYSSLRTHFTKEEVDKVTHHPKPLLNNLSYLLFPRKTEASQALLSSFNKQLKLYRENGKYESYFKALQRGDYHKHE